MQSDTSVETLERSYSTINAEEFERDRKDLSSEGWVITEIRHQRENQGCAIPVIGALMIKPSQRINVMYQRGSNSSST